MSGLAAGPTPLAPRSRPTRRRCGTINSNFKTLITWCNEAAGHIVTAKQSIKDNVTAGLDEINNTQDAASQSDQDPTAAIEAIVHRKYGENVGTLSDLAKSLGFGGGVPAFARRT